MNNDLLTLAKTYPEYQSLMNIAKAIRANNLANYFNCEDIETIQNSLFEKAQQEKELGLPLDIYIELSRADSVVTEEPEWLVKKQNECPILNIVQSKISLDEDSFYVTFELVDPYEPETIFITTITLYYSDYKKTWWLEEGRSK